MIELALMFVSYLVLCWVCSDRDQASSDEHETEGIKPVTARKR